MNIKKMSKRTGRPRSFDRARALKAAMHLFWAHGYEGSSISALTDAMGITPPSLYSAFGDKASLFIEAAHLYAGTPEALAAHLASAPTAHEAMRSFLCTSAQLFSGQSTPPGCLLASAVASGPPATEVVRAVVGEIRGKMRGVLRERIEQGVRQGELRADACPAALADMVMALTQGMSVLARDGVGGAALVALAECGIAGWPCSTAT